MKLKAFLAAVAFIATMVTMAAIGVAQPALASSIGHHGGGKSGTNESRSTSLGVRPMYDSNDPIDSGCTTNTTVSTKPNPTSVNYGGHTYQIQIRYSPKCNKVWARLWETSGSGDCIVAAPSPDWLEITNYFTNQNQSVAGNEVCDDAWTDMVSYTSGRIEATVSNGSYNLGYSEA